MKVVKYQDDLEMGRRSRKSHMSISEQVAYYRKKLLSKVTCKSVSYAGLDLKGLFSWCHLWVEQMSSKQDLWWLSHYSFGQISNCGLCVLRRRAWMVLIHLILVRDANATGPGHQLHLCSPDRCLQSVQRKIKGKFLNFFSLPLALIC